MNIKKLIVPICLGLILVLGFFLRFYLLRQVPAGLHYDEAQAGYNAFLISHFGKNLSGESWPLDIDSFGDYRPALISYLSVPFVLIGGLSIETTRAASSLMGFLIVILAGVFAQLCFNNKKVSLLTMLLTATSSMGIIFSRATTEGILEVAFTTGALSCLLLGLKKSRPLFFLLAYLFWVCSFFSYHTSRLLIPLMGAMTLFLGAWQFRPPKKIIFLGVATIIFYLIFPLIFFLNSPVGRGRFDQVSVFAFPEVQRSLDEHIREDGQSGNIFVSRLFHNKVVGYARDSVARYTNFLSPRIIIFNDLQPQRYQVPQISAISAIEYLGLLLALAFLLRGKPRPLFFLPLLLLLLAPIPSALTFEAEPNFQRAIFMHPFWQIVSGFGWIFFLSSQKNRLFRSLIVLAVIIVCAIQLPFFVHQYLVHEPKRDSPVWSRNTEMEGLGKFLYENKQKYSSVYLSESGGAYIYYLFFNKLDVFSLPVKKTGKYFTGDFSLDHLTLTKEPCSPAAGLLLKKYELMVVRQGCPTPPWAKKVATFNRSSGAFALAVYALESDSYNRQLELYNSATTLEDRRSITDSLSNSFIKP